MPGLRGRLVLAAALIAGGLTTSGCIRLVRTSTSTQYSGRYVSQSSYEQIEPGCTTGEWVKAVLGPPTLEQALDDGDQIWRYEYTRWRTRSGSVFLLFDGDNQSSNQGGTYVQVRDGIVVRKWRD